MLISSKTSYRSLFVAFIFCFAVTGCGYPEVSAKTYEIAKALFSACNRQSEEQIAKIERVINDAHESDEITIKEMRWLLNIVETGKAGKWELATAEARKLMEDQIEY